MDGGGEPVVGNLIGAGKNRRSLEVFAAYNKQRLIEKRENAAVIEAFAVIRMHAVVFLVGKTKRGNVVEDLGDNGGCFRGSCFLSGGRLLLLLDIFGGFAGKFAGKPREVQLAAGAAVSIDKRSPAHRRSEIFFFIVLPP